MNVPEIMGTDSPFSFGLPSPLPSPRHLSLPEPPKLCPTAQELRKAVLLLDMNGDRKIWEEDLDMLVELAYGLDLSRQAGKSWQAFKALCLSFDGLMDADVIVRSIDLGILEREMSKLSEEEGCRDDQGNAAALCRAGTVRVGGLEMFSSISQVIEAFNRFDGDQNGVICAKDLKQAARELWSTELTTEMCKDIIRRVDRNFDGVVELNEFGALLNCLSQC